MYEGLKKVVRGFNYYMCMIGMFAVIPLMLLTTSDVIMRAVWSKPIPGTFELSEYLLAIGILLGAAYTQQVKGHVGVDFLIKRFHPRLRGLCGLITSLGCLIVLALLSWQGYVRALQETTVSDMLRVPQAPFRFLVFVAGVTLFMEFLFDMVDAIGALARRGHNRRGGGS